MKKRILSIVSFVLIASTLLFTVGCDSIKDDETSKVTDTEKSGADTSTEKNTEKKTQKITEKITEKTTEWGKKTEMPMIPGQTKTDEVLTKKKYNFSEWSNCFRLIGRVENSSRGLIFDHAASAIEFHGFMTGDVMLGVNSNGESYFTVYIDGERIEERICADGVKNLKIATFEDNYFHTIRIVRQNEIAW